MEAANVQFNKFFSNKAMQINGYQTLPATFIKQSRAEPDFEVSVRDACISQFTKNKVMRQGFSSTL